MAESSALLGIVAVAAGVFCMRLAGFLLGSRLAPDSTASRVLDALPGAALAGVVALALAESSTPGDLVALAATVGVFLWSGRTLPALALGLAIAVGNAHWLAGA